MRLGAKDIVEVRPENGQRVCRFTVTKYDWGPADSGVEGRAFLRDGYGETSYTVVGDAAPTEESESFRPLGPTGRFRVVGVVEQIIVDSDDTPTTAVVRCQQWGFELDEPSPFPVVGQKLAFEIADLTIWWNVRAL